MKRLLVLPLLSTVLVSCGEREPKPVQSFLQYLKLRHLMLLPSRQLCLQSRLPCAIRHGQAAVPLADGLPANDSCE